MTIRYPSRHSPEPALRVYRIREAAKLPERFHPTDAGMDLCYCPADDTEEVLLPGQSKVLPTGLKISVPPGHMLQIMNKSGIASKRSLVTGACVVDSGYDGEIFINLHNVGTKEQRIDSGDRIAQAVLIPIAIPSISVIEQDNIYGGTTSRGSGGFGSTGKQ